MKTVSYFNIPVVFKNIETKLNAWQDKGYKG
jgi:hypothetical protein